MKDDLREIITINDYLIDEAYYNEIIQSEPIPEYVQYFSTDTYYKKFKRALRTNQNLQNDSHLKHIISNSKVRRVKSMMEEARKQDAERDKGKTKEILSNNITYYSSTPMFNSKNQKKSSMQIVNEKRSKYNNNPMGKNDLLNLGTKDLVSKQTRPQSELRRLSASLRSN